MNPQDIIDAFFVQDGQVQQHGSIRRSVLLGLEKDFDFNILLPRVWTLTQSTIRLNDAQYRALQNLLPSFTVLSLFCTAVDVLARVVRKNARPPRGQNSVYFTDCAENWFGLSSRESRELWQLRNGISHSYRLTAGRHAARQYGHGRILRQRPSDNVWEFYLHAMRGSLQNAKRSIYNHLSSETPTDKQTTATYLEGNGFFIQDNKPDTIIRNLFKSKVFISSSFSLKLWKGI